MVTSVRRISQRRCFTSDIKPGARLLNLALGNARVRYAIHRRREEERSLNRRYPRDFYQRIINERYLKCFSGWSVRR